MTAKKPQNSILVLATLGVYLGLVLVGATPQVWAQAAMSQQFDIKDEIEVTDELDKKPDDCEKLASKSKEKQQRFPVDQDALFAYSTAITALSNSLKQLKTAPVSIEGFALGEIGLPTNVSFLDDSSKPALISGKAKRKLDGNLLELARLFPSVSVDGRNRFEFALSIDEKGVVSTVRILRHNNVEAHQAFIAYDSLADLWRCQSKSAVDALVATNTQITWENNQVIITTRLPRAGLDSLLASSSK